MSLGRTVKLNTGAVLPQVGYGTWLSKPGEVENGVDVAIRTGYRHIDCARIYGNQNEVAEGIARAGVDRKELKIVSKLWNTHHRPEHVEEDLDLTLKQLKTDYLDVYLMHWPVPFVHSGDNLQPDNGKGQRLLDIGGPSIVDTWKEMIKLWKEGKKVKAIGVSNMNPEQIQKLIDATGVVPAMNQIECHPQLQQPELFKYCNDKGIIITAYSPLGNNIIGKPRVIDAEEVQKVAKALNKDPAQVCIAWPAHQGFCVIPKSVTDSRIKSNFQDFELKQSDFDNISKWGKSNYSRGNIPYLYATPWDINIFGEPEEAKCTNKVW